MVPCAAEGELVGLAVAEGAVELLSLDEVAPLDGRRRRGRGVAVGSLTVTIGVLTTCRSARPARPTATTATVAKPAMARPPEWRASPVTFGGTRTGHADEATLTAALLGRGLEVLVAGVDAALAVLATADGDLRRPPSPNSGSGKSMPCSRMHSANSRAWSRISCSCAGSSSGNEPSTSSRMCLHAWWGCL